MLRSLLPLLLLVACQGAGPAAAPVAPVPVPVADAGSEPVHDVLGARFVAPDRARIELEDPVDVTALRVDVSAKAGPAPAVAAWTRVDESTLEVRLYAPHHPVEHTFAIHPLNPVGAPSLVAVAPSETIPPTTESTDR